MTNTHRSALEWLYRLRWHGTIVGLAVMALLLVAGVGRIQTFSSQVDALAGSSQEETKPRLFDTRADIWFDPQDEGLTTYRDVERRFIAEDIVLVAFEDTEHPWGVFNPRALSVIQRLGSAIERIPGVRGTRSLASSAWIRSGTVEGERSLVVGELFEGAESHGKQGRIERMIAVLGAERAARIAGVAAVKAALGADANFRDHPGESRFVNSIVSEDGKTAVIQVQLLRQHVEPETLDAAFPEHDSQKREIGAALHSIELQSRAVAEIQKLLSEQQHYEMHLSGVPVLERHFAEVGQHDTVFVGAMFVAMALVLAFVFRRISGVVLPLLVVFAATVGMNGTVWLFGDLLNNLTAIAPIIVTAAGIADSVHLVATYTRLRPQFSDKHLLVMESMRQMAWPIFWTSATTAAGFFSLMTSGITPVRMLGYTAGIGTLYALGLSMTVVPAALSLLPLKASRVGSSDGSSAASTSHWSDGLLNAVLPRSRAVALAAIAICLVAGIGLYRLKIETDLRLMFPEDDPVAADLRWTEAHLGGFGDLDLVFDGAEARDTEKASAKRQARIQALHVQRKHAELSRAEQSELAKLERQETEHQRGRIAVSARFLSRLDAFEQRLLGEASNAASPLRHLSSFDSALGILRKVHQVHNGDRVEFSRVPRAEDIPESARQPTVVRDEVTGEEMLIPGQTPSSLVSHHYVEFENGAEPSQGLAPFVSQDRRSLRVAARISSAPTTQLLEAYERIRTIARQEFPDLVGSEQDVKSGRSMATMRLSGKHYLFMNMMQRFSETLISSSLLALVVVVLLIAFAYRSAWLGLVALVVNVLPLLVPIGVLGFIGQPLDGPVVLVVAVALGVCVDDTIHLFESYKYARARGLVGDPAVRYAVKKVSSACTWTTLVLVIGFGMLTMSGFRGNAMIGLLGAVTVFLAWVADMVVTPALLRLLPHRAPLVDTSAGTAVAKASA